MTADLFATRPVALQFIDDAPPLPLLDPTIAADRVGIRRHTLACYRNRGSGPRWFKFGKWVRYIPEDLDAWLGGDAPRPAIDALSTKWHPDEARDLLVPMTVASRILTVTRHCMTNYRYESSGPVCRKAGRRLYYALADLLEWAAAQQQPVQSGLVIDPGSNPIKLISNRPRISLVIENGRHVGD